MFGMRPWAGIMCFEMRRPESGVRLRAEDMVDECYSGMLLGTFELGD